MSVPFRGGLFGFISRLGRPPTVDSDADLLDRFVRTADETAFSGIVRRHGLMVLAICRRRLCHEADAEDAFQAVFLALAKSAKSIDREMLPGWLYRVAYLISLKAAGIRARQPVVAWPTAEVSMPNPSTPPWETEELKNVIDEELAHLPVKFRSVVALCLIEGRTNVEAAGMLGIPVGTIDSRLHSAKKRLSARLGRRGVAVGGGVTLGQMLGGPLTAANEQRIMELVSHVVPAVLVEAAGSGTGTVSPTVANLAKGVTMLTTTRLRIIATMGVAIGILGGTATGIYLATAADPPKPVPNQTVKSQDTPSPVVTPEKTLVPMANAEPSLDGGFITKPLKKLKLDPNGCIVLKDFFEALEDETELIVRVDVGAFRRLGMIDTGDGADVAPLRMENFLKLIYDTKAILPRRANKLPLRDVLSDALAQISLPQGICTYQIRGTQLVIIPSFEPPVKPGIDALNPVPQHPQPGLDEEEQTILPMKMLWAQIYGGVVNVSADKKPLTEILADLRQQTGANIVLDPRCQTQTQKAALTLSLSDVRLYDALRVIADLAELKMVYAGNIYYVTTLENAKSFQPPPVVRPIVYSSWPGGGGGPIPQPVPATNPIPAADPKKP
jgi:RNA polymerase sigma factor (sigma-70 family)